MEKILKFLLQNHEIDLINSQEKQWSDLIEKLHQTIVDSAKNLLNYIHENDKSVLMNLLNDDVFLENMQTKIKQSPK